MTKRRLLIVVIITIVFVLVFSFSSTVFELKVVDVAFYNNGQMVSYTPELSAIRQRIISETTFDYGSSIFFVSNDKYNGQIEYNEPNLKVLGMEKIFPNKLLIKMGRRDVSFYFVADGQAYLLDCEFKLIDIQPAQEWQNTLLQKQGKVKGIYFENNGIRQDYFTFFGLSKNVLDCGQFLTQSNKIFNSTANLHCFANLNKEMFDNMNEIIFCLDGQVVKVKISTFSGVLMEVEDVLEKFDEKFLKLCNAYFTLSEKEKIKTTHGVLRIDANKNVFWST